MKARIDESRCIGCGVCANICPQGIEMMGGKAKIKNDTADCLEDAARVCPRDSIIIEGKNKVEEPSREDIKTGFNAKLSQGRGMRINGGIGRRQLMGRGRGEDMEMGRRMGGRRNRRGR